MRREETLKKKQTNYELKFFFFDESIELFKILDSLIVYSFTTRIVSNLLLTIRFFICYCLLTRVRDFMQMQVFPQFLIDVIKKCQRFETCRFCCVFAYITFAYFMVIICLVIFCKIHTVLHTEAKIQRKEIKQYCVSRHIQQQISYELNCY